MKKPFLIAGTIAAVTGTALLSKNSKPVIAQSSSHSNFLAWSYPPNINPNNYMWYLQMTTDFVHWATIQTNSGHDDMWVDTKTNPFAFYRLSSQP